ncbi:hypothetical protein [Vibrio anguillarum]|uniref:Uncharacterized protein n=2 Tax=Vibrio anguillarum TaxID=55601 RepID=A0A7U6J6B4_VIBAN|nr:hypothetical protein [Vibrio anguillarum]AZS26317.1 hypothetical protein DYL72_15525 [Vibrio anguillarum]MBF4374462.1 hypothetical protein [Vibrio anguillarum]
MTAMTQTQAIEYWTHYLSHIEKHNEFGELKSRSMFGMQGFFFGQTCVLLLDDGLPFFSLANADIISKWQSLNSVCHKKIQKGYHLKKPKRIDSLESLVTTENELTSRTFNNYGWWQLPKGLTSEKEEIEDAIRIRMITPVYHRTGHVRSPSPKSPLMTNSNASKAMVKVLALVNVTDIESLKEMGTMTIVDRLKQIHGVQLSKAQLKRIYAIEHGLFYMGVSDEQIAPILQRIGYRRIE